MILFKGGQPVKTVIGAYPKKKLEQELEPALTRRAGRRGRSQSAASGARAEAIVELARPSMSVVLGVVQLGSGVGGRAELQLDGQRLAGEIVAMRLRGVDQRGIARERQLDAVLDLQAGALARVLHRVHDLAGAALTAQVLVDRQIQRDRVRSLALDAVAVGRAHRQDHVPARACARVRRP